MFLEFDFMLKPKNSKIIMPPWVPQIWTPFFWPKAKIINLLPILLALCSHFQKGMSWRCRTKTQGSDRFGKNWHFLAQGPTLRAGGVRSPTQKLLEWSWTGPDIFNKIHSSLEKLNHIFSWGQTQRHTDRQTHNPLGLYPYRWVWEISPCIFSTFSLTMFVHSLRWFTHINCEDK